MPEVPVGLLQEEGLRAAGKDATLPQASRPSQTLALLLRAPQEGEEEPAPWMPTPVVTVA